MCVTINKKIQVVQYSGIIIINNKQLLKAIPSKHSFQEQIVWYWYVVRRVWRYPKCDWDWASHVPLSDLLSDPLMAHSIFDDLKFLLQIKLLVPLIFLNKY